MAKKPTRKKRPATRETELARRAQPDSPEPTATLIRKGKKVTITKRNIPDNLIPPSCIVGWEELTELLRGECHDQFQELKAALCSDSKELQDAVMNMILGDLVIGVSTTASCSSQALILQLKSQTFSICLE